MNEGVEKLLGQVGMGEQSTKNHKKLWANQNPQTLGDCEKNNYFVYFLNFNDWSIVQLFNFTIFIQVDYTTNTIILALLFTRLPLILY